MKAGLTSNTAMVLRDELSKDLLDLRGMMRFFFVFFGGSDFQDNFMTHNMCV